MTQAGQEFLTPLRRNRSFVLLWTGQSISLTGSQVTTVALPLVAAVSLQASPWEMGVLVASSRAPYLFFGLIAGAWVDRLPRRPVLMACVLGQAAVLGLVPLAALLNALALPLLFGVAFTAGTLAVFADIASLALVPMVVPRPQLTGGQSALETSASASQVVGPSVAGWLVQLLSAPVAVLADSLSFLVSAATLTGVRVEERRRRGTGGPSMLRQITEGGRAVFHPPVLRYVTLCTATHIFFFNAFLAALLLFLPRELGMPAGLIGIVLASGAVGGLVGSIVAQRIGKRFGLGRTMATAIVVTGLGSIPTVFADDSSARSVAIVVASQVLLWFALQIYNVHQVPVRYALTEQSLHGRVNATIRTTVWGTAPLGALVGGAVGELAGLRAALLLGGVGAALAALWLVLSKVRAVRSLDPA